MATLAYDLILNQGETFSVTFPVVDANNNPINVTGWTAKAQVRGAPGEPVLYEWSIPDGNMIVAGTSVTLTVAPAVSETWTWIGGNVFYDLYVTEPGGQQYRLAAGRVTVSPEITQFP